MKRVVVIVSLVAAMLLAGANNQSVFADSYTSLNTTDGLSVSTPPDPQQTITASDTISTGPITVYPSTSSDTSLTVSTSSTQISPTTGSTTSPTGSQPVNIQGDTSSDTTGTVQSTFYYGPPQLLASSPVGGGAISGDGYLFTATISDPNKLVYNVHFKLYDPNRNVLLDTNSSMNSAGEWVANNPFDSTQYPDGYGYSLEITTEGSSVGSVSGTGYTLSSNTVYFGIDNVRSNDIVTYPDASGSTIINKDFTATAYQYIPYGDIPVATTFVQFYYLDSLGNRILQGSPQALTKSTDPYSGLWSTQSIDSRTFFSKGNGQYVAVFTATYTDGATKSVEATFEVYNSDDVTPPTKPTLVSPANGITMAPGSITYSWTGNEGDDIVGLDFERGDIDPTTGTFVGRAGGYRDVRDGSFSWTESNGYVPSEAYTVNWRIRVRDRAGNWSEWSNVSRYTIDPNFVPDTTPPPQPIILSPTDNQNVNNDKVVQSWQSDANDIDYYLYESYKDPQRNTLISQEKVSTNSRTTINQKNGAFWWRVQAVDKSGNKSAWSDLYKMTVSNTAAKK